MLEFLKNLFAKKKDEQEVYIPPAYIAPTKKSTNIDDLLKEETTNIVYSENTVTAEPVAEIKQSNNKSYSIDQEWYTFKEDGKYGYKDENGDKVIGAKFDTAWDFMNGCAIVTVKEKKGIIDTKGNYLLQPEYDYIDDEYEGLFKLEKNNKYGFALPNGSIPIPVQYVDCGEFSENLVWVEHEKGMVGFIDKQGNTIIDFKFDYCGDFSEGLASATKFAEQEGQDDKSGYIDKSGNFIIELDYDEAGDFKEGLAPVCLDGKYTFITKSGKQVCQPLYNSAGNFVNGLSCVQLESSGKWGYADTTGKLVIPCKFKETSNYLDEEEQLELIAKLKKEYL